MSSTYMYPSEDNSSADINSIMGLIVVTLNRWLISVIRSIIFLPLVVLI